VKNRFQNLPFSNATCTATKRDLKAIRKAARKQARAQLAAAGGGGAPLLAAHAHVVEDHFGVGDEDDGDWGQDNDGEPGGRAGGVVGGGRNRRGRMVPGATLAQAAAVGLCQVESS
jgi:hypothetical protein